MTIVAIHRSANQKFFHRGCEYSCGRHLQWEWATSEGWYEFNLASFLHVHRYLNFDFDLATPEDDQITRIHFGLALGYIRFSVTINLPI